MQDYVDEHFGDHQLDLVYRALDLCMYVRHSANQQQPKLFPIKMYAAMSQAEKVCTRNRNAELETDRFRTRSAPR